jgi:SAM-dependent methyltransferase
VRLDEMELLDDPRVDDVVRLAALRDVERANAFFGGARVVVRELLNERPRRLTVLDVGTGTGDIPARARELARRSGMELSVIGVDLSPALARAARERGVTAVAANAFELPFATRSVDIVVCSQLLHHFRDGDAITLLRELNRVARRRVIVSDLERSWFAALGFRLAAWVLRFHPVARHDGLVSIRRGFTPRELAQLVRAAAGRVPVVRRRLCFRLIASWTPRHQPRPPAGSPRRVVKLRGVMENSS